MAEGVWVAVATAADAMAVVMWVVWAVLAMAKTVDGLVTVVVARVVVAWTVAVLEWARRG